MIFVVWMIAGLAAWLSIHSLRAALGNGHWPFGKPLKTRVFVVFFIALWILVSILGLYCLNRVLPPLQSGFAWLGLLSACGILQLFVNPTLKSASKSPD
ncbi:MAG: hypothetical protein ACRBBW_02190 [Cellvibrionaceae bacterium]